VLAKGVAEILTQVVFCQLFVIQHVTTRLLKCEPEISYVFIFSSTYNQLVIFDVIVFPLAAFMLFRDLSHKNAWINHIINCFIGMIDEWPEYCALLDAVRGLYIIRNSTENLR